MFHSRSLRVVFFCLLIFVLALGSASTAYASAIDNQTFCEDNGGSWDGSNVEQGTCTYPQGNNVAKLECGGADYILTYTFGAGGAHESTTCTLVEEQDDSTPGFVYGACGDQLEGASSDTMVLTPCGDNGGTATFGPGSCPGYCTTSTYLPRGASDHLPGNSVATLYVMTRNADGTPSNDSYTACFNNPDGGTHTLYRFVSGAWLALVTSNGNPICAGASGDGAFYLGPAE